MKQYQINRIKQLMEAKEMSIQELAFKCGVSAMTIGRILNNSQYNPTTDTIEKIAKAIGVTEQYIYEAEAESKSLLPINGYIEYGGTITSVKTFKQLEKLYENIKYDMNVSKKAKELRAKDKERKKTQESFNFDIYELVKRLDKEEEYDTSKVKTWSFLHIDDVRNGISLNIGNFSPVHDLYLDGEHFFSSESAYIVGLFSRDKTEDNIKAQKEIQYEKSPNDAKFIVRPRLIKKGLSRKDWDSFKHQWMLYVVWQKCLTNKEFADLLRKIPNDVIIIENTTNQTGYTSDFWGAKNKELEDGHDLIEREVTLNNPSKKEKELKKLKSIERNKLNNIGVWKGINCLGKCLNICKYCLEKGLTPPIDYDLLRSKQIFLFGKLLTFEEKTPSISISTLKITKTAFKGLDKEQLIKSKNEILAMEAFRTKEYRKKWEQVKPITWSDFDFKKEHIYDTQKIECWSFSKGKGHRNGIQLVLGNMSNDFGVEILGIKFPNSEVPFQLADFKNDEASINIQKEIINSKTYLTNGYIMKHKFCNERDYVENRRDIEFDLGDETWCYEWMKWIVWEKVKQNKGFQEILLSIPENAMIIEKAQRKTDTKWGAWNEELMKERTIVIKAVKAETRKGNTSQVVIDAHFLVNNKGKWKGINLMGQILTMAKLALNQGVQLPIDEQQLNAANICWLGDTLRFAKHEDGAVTVEAIKL